MILYSMGKCNKEDCKNNVMKYIGKCSECEHSHCQLHRLPESHYCKELRTRQLKEINKLASKLYNESKSFTPLKI